MLVKAPIIHKSAMSQLK